MYQSLDRALEVEVIFSITHTNDFRFCQHFKPEQIVFIDNIYGGFDACPKADFFREGGAGARFNTWVRARHIVALLLANLNLHPVLSFITPHKHIKGLGISDDPRYANILAGPFDYRNTFYDVEPKLDIMTRDEPLKGGYDFIICSDVLEHVIGDWRVAIENLHYYLKDNGLLILTVPYDRSLPQTKEHYPDCTGYTVTQQQDGYNVVIDYAGYSSVATHPCFHGGPGNTLEMRQFSLTELLAGIRRIGFNVDVHEDNDEKFGIIYNTDNVEGVLVCKK